eukprot:gnl/TRDRNA2_/TRDRNA2_199037_c0_seq1.p1 gnl/TRDRNA2_/TRDRNA2_199037_c0~~gnl/TRDRNA2_/TRDRNA2_199037_c0_seq1.p1  ORF type:complete len:214 (-),score=27.67 gnl/TRDRNA2_/TRDRNA2_199037_c0_seq1:70-675(-)
MPGAQRPVRPAKPTVPTAPAMVDRSPSVATPPLKSKCDGLPCFAVFIVFTVAMVVKLVCKLGRSSPLVHAWVAGAAAVAVCMVRLVRCRCRFDKSLRPISGDKCNAKKQGSSTLSQERDELRDHLRGLMDERQSLLVKVAHSIAERASLRNQHDVADELHPTNHRDRQDVDAAAGCLKHADSVITWEQSFHDHSFDSEAYY